MAEYRGLTIRIGADTSRLSAALRATKGAISEAQGNLRRLKQAMNLDPGNKNLGAHYIGELQNKAVDASARIRALKTEIKNLSDAASSSDKHKTIGQLAEETDNAALSAQRARQAYNDVTEALATIYTNISDLSHATFDLTPAQYEEELTKLKEAGMTAKQAKAEIDRMFEQGKTFNADNSDIGEIEAELQRLVEAEKRTQDEADETIATISRLKKVWGDYSNSLDDAKAVSTIERDKVEMEQLEAQVKATTREMVEASQSDFSLDIEPEIAKLKNLHSATEAAKNELKLMDEALEADPTSLDKSIARAEALKKTMAATKDESEQLNVVLGKYHDAGLDEVYDTTKNIAQATDDAKEKWIAYEAAVTEAKESVDDMGVKAKQMRVDGDTMSGAWLKLGRDAKATKGDIEDLADSARQAGDEFHKLDDAKGLENWRSEAQRLANDLDTLGDKAGETGERMSTSMILVLRELADVSREALTAVVETTVGIDDGLTNVRKTVETSEEGYQQLKDSAIELSKTQPIDAATILNAESLGGQLGFAADEVERLAMVSTGLDVSTNMDWDQAATNMAQFANIMQMNHDEIENYGSAIVELGNNFETTESDISDMAMRIAGAGASLNLSSADVLGLATALTSMGLTAEAGGSSISQIMIKIDKAVAQGSDGVKQYADQMGMSLEEFKDHLNSLDDDAFEELASSFGMTAETFDKETRQSMNALETWAETAGMTTEEFVRNWSDENGPIDVIENIFKGMEAAKEDGSNLALLLDSLGVSTIRQSDVARRLASNSEKVGEAVRASNEAWKENTALATEVERRNESLSGQMAIMSNAFDAFKNELGEGLLPLVKIGVSFMQEFSTVLDDVPTPIKSATIAMLGMLTGYASAAPLFDRMGEKLGDVRKKFVQFAGEQIANGTRIGNVFKSIATSWSSASGVLTGSMTSLLSISKMAYIAVGALAAGIAALAVAEAVKAKKVQSDFYESLANVGKYANVAASGIDTYREKVGLFPAEAREMATSTEELTEMLSQHNQKMVELESGAVTSAEQLQRYKDVIDELGGKGALTTEEHTKLQWALEGLNEVLGTTISEEEVLNGTYEDEDGNIQSMIEHLDQLIEKRRNEARLDTDKELYEEALRNESELTRSLDETTRAYEGRKEELVEMYSNTREFAGKSKEEILDFARAHNKDFRDMEADVRNLTFATKAASEETSTAYNAMINDTAIANLGIPIEEFRQSLVNAGLSAEELARITPAQFASILESTGTNVDAIIDELKKIEENPVEITAESDVGEAADEAQTAVDGVEQSNPVEISADASNVANTAEGAQMTLDTLANGTVVPIRADGSQAKQEASTTGVAINSIKQTSAIGISANGSEARREAESVASSINSIPDRWVSINVATSGLGSALAAIEEVARRAANVGRNAAGGIRYHADGLILDRPTWISSNDIAGEAGAEAIIPLTNRKYVQPFADTVADGMISKLGSISGDTNYNITVYANGDSGDEIASAVVGAIRSQNLRSGRVSVKNVRR